MGCLAAAIGCFTGDGLEAQPCRTDEDCNAWADVLGKRITCHDGVCGALCGDREVHPGIEECDDGDDDDTDDCVACRKAYCGDGAVRAGHEQCDDGNDRTDDGCVDCQNAVCGDGFVWAGKEGCDDGNDVHTDGCATCEAVVCGDSVVHALAEACDDGNLDDDDGCNNACIPGAEDIAAGFAGRHTCALRQGKVRCWGANEYGQLGYGHVASVGDEAWDLPPGDVGFGGVVTQVALGDSFTCALVGDGPNNLRCPLGLTAELWEVPLGGAARHIAGGYGFGCAALVDGAVNCWSFPDLSEPLFFADEAVQVTASDYHHCALLAGGSVQCFGQNVNGYLGDPSGPPDGIGAVVRLGGKVVQVTGGTQHTCALLADGAVRCWGNGVLGYGNSEIVGDDEHPDSVDPIDLGGPAVHIAAGGAHTCAARQDGRVLCWGLNGAGNLGYGNLDAVGDDEDPAAYGPVALGDAAAVRVAAGGAHSCALFRGGGVRCWGANDVGQLGVGHTESLGDEPGEMPPPLVHLYAQPE